MMDHGSKASLKDDDRRHDAVGGEQRGEVRSLVRGLDVLIVVNESPPATVSRIVAQTGLPKATVVRILNTLRARGYIAQNKSGGGYRPLPRVRRLASAMMVENPFLSEARRLLAEFGHVTKWPSDLLLAEPDAMLIVASNRDTAPLRLTRFEQRRFPMLDSAAGLAYLAALDPPERERIITSLAAMGGDAEDATARAGRTYTRVQAVRERGYALRDYQAPIDGTRAIAVAITSRGAPVGAIVLIVLRDAITDEQLEGSLVPALSDQAQRLGEQHELLADDVSGSPTIPVHFAEPIP